MVLPHHHPSEKTPKRPPALPGVFVCEPLRRCDPGHAKVWSTEERKDWLELLKELEHEGRRIRCHLHTHTDRYAELLWGMGRC